MPALAADLRNAVRAIRRMPGLALVVVLSLGVGIGVNAAIFSWMQAVVFEPIRGVAASGSFQLIEPKGETGSYPGTSWLEYRDMATRLSSIRQLMAFRMAPLNVGAPEQAERAYGLLVSGNYFSALGLRPAAGRLLSPDDAGVAGARAVVVISHDYWHSRFSGRPSAVGQSLRVNDRPLTIVGVAPDGFQGTLIGLTFDLWVPATMAPVLFDGSSELESRDFRGYSALGRLQAGVTPGAAQREVTALMQQLAFEHPPSNQTMGAELVPIWDAPRGPQRFMVSALSVLQGVLILVLLTVCGNTANLMLARASSRTREVAVRLALGARRAHIVRLILTESVMLAMAGTGTGLVVAMWATEALRAVPMTAMVPIKFQTGVDGVTVLFVCGLGLVAAVLFGLAPALRLARLPPQAALRSGAQVTRRHRTHEVLMAAEVALALVVLVAAGLFLESFRDARTTDPGFTREGVMLAAYDLRGRSQDVTGEADRIFAARVLDGLRASPLVSSAAIAASVPLDIHGLGSRTFTIEGRARTDDAADEATTNTITSGYFDAMGIPFVAGRDLAGPLDDSRPAEVIVNEAFVQAYVSSGQPIGRRIQSGGRAFVICGVVRTSLSNAFGEPPTPVIYFSYRDRPAATGEIHARARGGREAALVPEIRRAVSAVNPGLPIYNVRSLTEHVDRNLVFRRIPARLFIVLGPLLLVLAAVGISAVVAYTVARRRVEIGVRIAVGGSGAQVVRHLVLDTMRFIAIGAAAGWSLAFSLTRLLGGEASVSAAVFVAAPAVLMAAALAACWWPAHRAVSSDPIRALRQDA